jgi:tetratricopeptide (TPR) repeat protein
MRAARFLKTIPLLVTLTVASLAAPARADDAAEAKHAQGTALTKSGNYEGARMKFLEALSMRPMSKTFLNLCVVEQHLGLEPEAIAHCKQFLASDAAPRPEKDGRRRHLP